MLFTATETSPGRTRGSLQIEQVEKFVGTTRCVVVRGGEVEHLTWRHREPDAATLQQRSRAHDDFTMIAQRIESVDAHRSRRWWPESEQRLDDGGLSRPVWSEQRDHFAVGDVKGDVVDCGQLAEVDCQIIDLDRVAHDLRT